MAIYQEGIKWSYELEGNYIDQDNYHGITLFTGKTEEGKILDKPKIALHLRDGKTIHIPCETREAYDDFLDFLAEGKIDPNPGIWAHIKPRPDSK